MESQKIDIKDVWNAEQKVLDVIHDVCVKNGLKYSLCYGTLIGAVRHGGFIPWDDDIDIMMPREDYEKLIKIWNKVAPKGYVLQNKRTNPDYSQNFTKIRKDYTTFVQFEEERSKSYHKGIFVDIFPGDRVAPSGLKRKLQYIDCALNLLFSRGFTSGSDGIIGVVERILIKIPKNLQLKLFRVEEKRISRFNRHKDYQYFFPCVLSSCKKYYSPDLFDELQLIDFNGKKYYAVKDADSTLKVEYGDYMKLPPEEERVWKHHPIVVDFEHNYEELI